MSTTTRPLFRVIIAGSRHFSDYDTLCQKCDAALERKTQTHTIVILSGGAAGADSLGERYAKDHGYTLRRYLADWSRDGRSAGILRNTRMVSVADALIAFWDGESHGTGHIIKVSKQRGLAVRVFSITPTFQTSQYELPFSDQISD